MKHYIEVSIYKMLGKRFPRLSILNDRTGTRIYGGKYVDFPSEESYKIPLDKKLIDEIINELQFIKKELGEKE